MICRRWLATFLVCAGLVGWSGPARAEPHTLSAADVAVTIDSETGGVTSLRAGAAAEEMVRPHPAGSEKPFGFVEVVDLRDGRTYHPAWVKSAIAGWTVGADKSVRFTQQYEGAPFVISHTLRPTPVGVRWDAAVRLLPKQRDNRSVEVAWMLPIPFGWRFWGPNDTTPRRTDEITPHRYVYAHTDHTPYGLIIPLVGAWGRRGGLALFSPPDVRKCQITFDVLTQRKSDPARGVHRRLEDLQMVRVGHHMVGLRPGKELKLAVCLAGCRPDWRAVLGHYVKSYPELFEPVPAARKYEGMYGISNASYLKSGRFDRFKSLRVRSLEVHGHFPEYGVYVTDEALKDPDLTWRCRPHRRDELSLAINRRIVAGLVQADVPPFMYYYNVHANAETIKQRFAADLMRRETGQPAIQYQGEPALRAQPDSGFGKHLIRQMDLMLKAYPQAPGFFVDNFVQEWLSFSHDDGVSMAHNRPCYDMNRNHQDIGPVVFDKAHKAGKVIMTNKLATIESARGVDMVLVESMSVHGLRMHAFACVYRSVFPLAWSYPRGRHRFERCLQHLLIWGGTPAATLVRRRGEYDTMAAYRPLTDAMVGKRWVFDLPDPLTLPEGHEGQVFRIDKAVSKDLLPGLAPHAPRGGDVVVSVVNLSKSWQDGDLTEGLTVTVRLPEAPRLKKATWLAPSAEAAKPVACEIQRDGDSLTVPLPPAGAAGILRLSP